MIEILTSIQDDFGYFDNLGYLRAQLQADHIQFQDVVANHAPDEIVFDTARIYDFTSSAGSKMREAMTIYLSNTLVGLQAEDLQKIREVFGCLFNYYAYKGYLDQVESHHHAVTLYLPAAIQMTVYFTIKATTRSRSMADSQRESRKEKQTLKECLHLFSSVIDSTYE
ncbi:hypothetical protein OS493_029497 [Desmophyllum pertusum]|uniref:Uncharacterized protein n=1 Tax=Desmophyllum pertusum TaxID=174260 RepID=A0A9W9YAF1_9CNID|nr:hypothetical protein OS493_029497 [Desmophyllum pertusum]